MADFPRFNWGQAAFALFMFALGTGVATVLFDHSAAIAENRMNIADVRKDVDHLEENSMTVTEQKDLCVTLAQLQDAVMQLKKEVQKLQDITP